MSVLEKMLDALTSAYNAKPSGNIGKLFSLFADSLESANGALETVRAWRDVDNARGRTLDRMGQNFGLTREGMPDAFLRLLIKVKMISLLSGGDIDTVIRAAASLYALDASKLELTELFPAKIQVALQETDLTQEQIDATPIIAAMIKRVIAAGVGFKVCLRSESTTPVNPLFLGFGLQLGGSITIAPWTYEVPDMTLPQRVGIGLSIHGTTTIRGESA